MQKFSLVLMWEGIFPEEYFHTTCAKSGMNLETRFILVVMGAYVLSILCSHGLVSMSLGLVVWQQASSSLLSSLNNMFQSLKAKQATYLLLILFFLNGSPQ